MKSWKKPTNEMIQKALESVKKETDRQYFFSKLKNPLWIQPLQEKGFFSSPPKQKELPGGYVQFPLWPELTYLKTIVKEAEEEVIDIILAIPESDNPRVYDGILEIAIKLEGPKSAKLLPKLIEYTQLENQFLAHKYTDLIKYWAACGNVLPALEVLEQLITFHPDPKQQEKRQIRKTNPFEFESLLNPTPKLDNWDYQEILEKGVAAISKVEPYKIASFLVTHVGRMLDLSTNTDGTRELKNEDYSELWCSRLGNPSRYERGSKENLVHALTHACEHVYNNASESIEDLDQDLRKSRWKLFKRLRQHLYANNPNETTLPWIREFIIEHKDYSISEFSYEFQLMIREACVFFGRKLLNDVESNRIFTKILNGPSEEDFRNWTGNGYSTELFKKRQRHFHRLQLRPFEAILTGEFKKYYDELEREASDPVTDEAYSPFEGASGGEITYRSPKSFDELSILKDEEILDLINNWNQEHRDKDDWLIEINVPALAGIFQKIFKQIIIPDNKRLEFWFKNRDRIKRTVFITSMVRAMQDNINEHRNFKINEWIEFCAWVLEHPDTDRSTSNWAEPRGSVVSFIALCVNKETEVGIEARKGLADLLMKVCKQQDCRLDNNRPVFLSKDDPIAEAINNTRSRALEILVHFGYWVRRSHPEDHVTEVIDIISNRLVNNIEIPLSRPEHAILGMHFGNLCNLNRDWALLHRAILFPHHCVSSWLDAFGSYIRYNRPNKELFDMFSSEYEFALEHLDELLHVEDLGVKIVDRIGQHLFIYYLWGLYPLRGDSNLLECFYEKTKGNRQSWAALFDYIGRSLSQSKNDFPREFLDRLVVFFEWRLGIAEHLELQEFTFWLESDILDPTWRLTAYSKILNHGRNVDVGLSMEVKTLSNLVPTNLSLVIECLHKISKTLKQGEQFYISTKPVKSILNAGFSSEDDLVREKAEEIRDKFLRLGFFELMDMSSPE